MNKKMYPVTVYIPQELKQWIEQHDEINFSGFIRECIRKKMEQEKEMKK